MSRQPHEDMEVAIEAGGRTARTTLGGLEQLAKPELGQAPPEGFILSEEVATIAREVIDSDPRFAHVDQFRVGYALQWGKDPEGRGGIHVLAKAVKAPALWADLGEYDCVVWANQRAWVRLPQGARQALIAHELCHIGMTEKGALTMLEHDIEEFAWVARRFGQWHSGLEHFAEQLGLGLEEPRSAPAAES